MKKIGNKATKLVKNVLDATLKSDANTASCVVIHQPKAPAKLEKFKKHV